MHSEYVDGLTLRPLMDAGWTAWLDGERVGTVRLADGAVVVRAPDPRVRKLLVERLAADLRAAGVQAGCTSAVQNAQRVAASGIWLRHSGQA